MPSAVAEQFVRSNYVFGMWDHDPGVATALVTSPDGGTTQRWWDMRDLQRFAAAAMATIFGAASGITKLEIVAADDAAGTNLTVIKDSGTVDADAMGDWLMEECSADEVRHISDAAGLRLRYVAARLTCSDVGDEAVVMYFGVPVRRYLNRTPATTIS